MGMYRNVGETVLKFPGHPPYGKREQFRADLSTEQERLLVACGAIAILEASDQPVEAEPAAMPAVRGPLGAGEDATPDIPKAEMTLPIAYGPGDNPPGRVVVAMPAVRGPLGAGEDARTVTSESQTPVVPTVTAEVLPVEMASDSAEAGD